MQVNQTGKEIEVRFLEINQQEIISRLAFLGFEDKGEDFFTEIIFYDAAGKWIEERKIITRYVRLRKNNQKTILTYKMHRQDIPTTEAREIEFEVSDILAASELLEILGLKAFRKQEKKRHKFTKGDVTVDIDTWPRVPTYLEIEAPTEEHLKNTASDLGFGWDKAVYENAGNLIEKYYDLMVSKMSVYTFSEITYRDKGD